MNFQHARNNPGNFIQMQGTATKFDIKTHAEYGNYALGKLKDNLGEEQKMFFAASKDSPLPDQTCMNQLGIWGVKFDANTGKYKAYYNGAVAQQLQPQQASAQPTNYQQPAPQGKKEPDWDAIAQGKVRCNVLCAMLQGGISVDYPEVLRHTTFVMTGIDADNVSNPDPSITNPGYVGDNPDPPSQDSEIPF